MEDTSKIFKSLRGVTKFKSKNGKHTIKEISIKNIFDCYSQNIIIIPEFQRLLDLEKVHNMIIRYKKDGESFRFLTNYIQLICIDNNKYLVLDGQHRLNMYEKLVEEKVINDETTILVNIINETNEDEIYELYKNLNYDISNQLKPSNQSVGSVGSDQSVKLDESLKIFCRKLKYSQLNELLGQHSKRFLSNSKFIYSLDEFINILYNNSYIEAFPSSTASEAYNYLMKANSLFMRCYYTENIMKNIIFNSVEEVNFKKNFILNFKQNNFINLLIDNDILNESFTGIHTWSNNNLKHSLKKVCNSIKNQPK